MCGEPAEVNDHDHNAGRLRGVLCHRCNRFLGIAGDDLQYLEKAAAYLRRYQDEEPPDE
jgi:hypothetical protein